MHVLIIPSERYVTADKPLGAIFQYHQAHALKDAGLNVGVIAPTPRSLRDLRLHSAKWFRGVEFYVDDGIPTYRFQGMNWVTGKLPVLYQSYWEWIGVHLYKKYVSHYGKPDIIHAHNAWPAGVFAARHLVEQGIPLVITEHSSMYFRRGVSQWQRKMVSYALRCASARIMVSSSLGRQLKELFREDVEPWTVIPNILDSMFEESESCLSAPEKEFVFLNVAMLQPVKNQEGLLKAFRLAFLGNPKVQLRIGGDGPLMNRLQGLSNDLGIAEQVYFLGRLSRKQVLLEIQKSNVFVLSSLYETFGVVLTEAAACGKPLIATASGGPEDIVNKNNGILVPPGDVGALAEAMVWMYEHASDYDPVAIRRFALSQYGRAAVVGRLKKIYTRASS